MLQYQYIRQVFLNFDLPAKKRDLPDTLKLQTGNKSGWGKDADLPGSLFTEFRSSTTDLNF